MGISELATVFRLVFPDADGTARGYGAEAVTVRSVRDLDAVREWVAGPRIRPLLIDAKVSSDGGAWWLEEAFKGH